MVKERPKCKTGIEGLDNILNGGIPRGNTVLLSGACGSGKTTLGMEFLVNGAKMDETSVFISVTEPSSKVISNLRGFEFFDESLIKKEKLYLLDMISLYARLGIEKRDYRIEDIDPLIKIIEDIVKKLKVKRLVIDSLTAICHQLETKVRIREFVFNLGKTLSDAGCTSLLISEVSPTGAWGLMPGITYSAYGVEEAIADGIILLGAIERKGYMLRTLHVVKMRGTMHSLAKHILDLTPQGVVLVPLLKWGAESG